MKIKIMSHRGDHEAVMEVADAKLVFDKLTGKTSAPLPAEVKTRIPDTFQELDALWTEGMSRMTVFSKSTDLLVTEFQDDLEDLLFMNPLVAG